MPEVQVLPDGPKEATYLEGRRAHGGDVHRRFVTRLGHPPVVAQRPLEERARRCTVGGHVMVHRE